MSRPEIAADELARMEKWFQDFLADPPPDLGFLKCVGAAGVFHIREVMFAGWWLESRLKAAGCAEQQCSDLCFAAGQLSWGADPWEASRSVLAGYLAGRPEKPGPRLAERIFNERFGRAGSEE